MNSRGILVLLAVFTYTGSGILGDGNLWGTLGGFYGQPSADKNAQAPTLWDGLRVKWSPLGTLGGFYGLPRTAKNARARNFTTPPEEAILSNDRHVEILCPKRDPTICLLFDKQGNIAGIEIGVLRAHVDNNGYPYEKHLMFKAKSRFGYKVYVTTLFFVEQEVLKAGGRTSMDATGTGTGLWLEDGPDRSMSEIPRLEKNIKETAYTKGNCIFAMGTHYYYNISESMQCEDFQPIFGLYNHGELVGFGYQTFGKNTPIGSRTWFEGVPTFTIKIGIKLAINNAPACLGERYTKYGIVSLHVYLVDQPFSINCF